MNATARARSTMVNVIEASPAARALPRTKSKQRRQQQQQQHRVGDRVVVTAGPWAQHTGTIVKRKKGGWWSVRLVTGELVKERTSTMAAVTLPQDAHESGATGATTRTPLTGAGKGKRAIDMRTADSENVLNGSSRKSGKGKTDTARRAKPGTRRKLSLRVDSKEEEGGAAAAAASASARRREGSGQCTTCDTVRAQGTIKTRAQRSGLRARTQNRHDDDGGGGGGGGGGSVAGGPESRAGALLIYNDEDAVEADVGPAEAHCAAAAKIAPAAPAGGRAARPALRVVVPRRSSVTKCDAAQFVTRIVGGAKAVFRAADNAAPHRLHADCMNTAGLYGAGVGVGVGVAGATTNADAGRWREDLAESNMGLHPLLQRRLRHERCLNSQVRRRELQPFSALDIETDPDVAAGEFGGGVSRNVDVGPLRLVPVIA